MTNEITTDLLQLQLTGTETYDIYIRAFNEFIGDQPIHFDLIKEFILDCKKKYKPSTIGCIKAGIKKSIVKTAGNTGRDILFLAALDREFSQIKVGRRDKRIYREKILSKDQIDTLIEGSTYRMSLIIKCLAMTGLRSSELCSIKVKDCKVSKDVVYITVIGKRNVQRRVFISRCLYDEIKKEFKGKTNLFETFKGNPFKRQYIYSQIKKAGEKLLDGKSISTHSLRHSFASFMLNEKGMSLKSVSNFLGHSSSSITSDFYHSSELLPEDVLPAWEA